MCSLFSVFTLVIESWKTDQLLWENFNFLAIFDTCYVVYHWSISLLPPIVLDTQFDRKCCLWIGTDLKELLEKSICYRSLAFKL